MDNVIDTESVQLNEVATIAYNSTNSADNEVLQQIHGDLSVILSVLIFFVLVIILKYTYSFFNMIFKF